MLLWGRNSGSVAICGGSVYGQGVQCDLLPQPCSQKHTAGKLAEQENMAFVPSVTERAMYLIHFEGVPLQKKHVSTLTESILKLVYVNVHK